MKKITKNRIYLLFLLFPLTLSAQTPKETEIQEVIRKSFDKIWSTLDVSEVENYYADDFLLLEDGEVLDRNGVKELMRNELIPQFQKFSENANGSSLKRINHIDAIKTSVSGNTAWISYHNTADFMVDDKVVSKAKWIESAVLVRSKGIWKVVSLHSTPEKKEEPK